MLLDQETLRFIFGLKLRGLRQEQELSLKELSRRSGLSLSYLNEIEKGKKYPKNDKIMILAEALGASYDDLISIKLKKELSNLTRILEHNLLQGLPFDVFGVPAQTLFELMAERPVQISGLIGTVLELTRKYGLSVEGFFYATLRAYIDMHSNYFEDLEQLANEFRHEVGAKMSLQDLRKYLAMRGGFEVVETDFAAVEPEADDLYYCYFSGKQKRLHINERLSDREKRFILLKEVAYMKLKIKERKQTSSSTSLDSYAVLYNNFQASYFASAYLIEENGFVDHINGFFAQDKFDGQQFQQMIQSYDGTVESFFHRLTQVLPRHYNIDQIFFLNFDYDARRGKYFIDKELHLSQLHAPHKAVNQEHYCARWISTRLLAQNAKHDLGLAAGAQVSHFFRGDERYLVLSVARQKELAPDFQTCASIGILLSDEVRTRVRFLKNISETRVGHTCERCGISDCLERRAEASIFDSENRQKNRVEVINNLRSQLTAR